MSEWIDTTLGNLLTIEHGYAFKGEFFTESGHYVLLTPGNFYDEGGFKLRPGKDRYYSGEIPQKYVLKSGDVIVAMTEQAEGLLGSSALIPLNDKYLHNQRLGLVQPVSDRADLTFLYYLFNTSLVRQQIRNSSSGAKVRHTSPARMYKVKVCVPVVAAQRKIATVLRTYDDLILTNKQRIRVNSTLADELYREWFVRFRFPGHRNEQFNKGMPASWPITKLKDVLELNYGKALKADDRIEGDYPVYGSGGIVGSHNRPLVEKAGIIVGRKGNVGSVYFSERPFFAIDTVYFVESSLNDSYLFFLLRSLNFVNNDAAVPGLNRNQAYANKFLLPPTHLIAAFAEIVDGLFAHNANLREQNRKLSEARDLLGRRLFSGQLCVSNVQVPSVAKESDVEKELAHA